MSLKLLNSKSLRPSLLSRGLQHQRRLCPLRRIPSRLSPQPCSPPRRTLEAQRLRSLHAIWGRGQRPIR